jgi:ABC-type multidrug transport system ATPase subunit
MDPQSRIALWQYLEMLKQNGTTILLTTQYLEEADRACDRIAIIDEGRLLKIGSPAVLKDELGADRITLTLAGGEDGYRKAAQAVADCPGVRRVERLQPLVLSVGDAGAVLPQVIRRIEAAGGQLLTIRNAPVTLDDVFLRYTGHEVRPDVNIGPAVSAAFATAHGGRSRQ